MTQSSCISKRGDLGRAQALSVARSPGIRMAARSSIDVFKDDSGEMRPVLRRRRYVHCFHLFTAALMLIAGCRGPQTATVGLPAKYMLEKEHIVVQSDVKLSRDHELMKDLDRLREQILTLLDLPTQKQPVVIYLFSDENRYTKHIHSRYPLLPPRRAYFVGTAKELAVYTYWGDRIQEDLRHEFTHGVLHATLKDVPLWLDEGLAEYFEVTGKPSGLNREYAMNLAADIVAGWKPDLDRLETLETVDQMQKADYQEAWAWVHFLLNHNEDSREVLTSYLRELRTNSQPGTLSARLRATIPMADTRFVNYAASLTNEIVRVGRIEPY